MIKIALADDHLLVREGIKQLLRADADMIVIGEAGNGGDLLQLLRHQPCHVLLLDLSMPGRSGVELISAIRAEFCKVAILVLTMHGERQYAVRALKAGANGYLTKDCAAAELLQAIRKVSSGGIYLSNGMAESIALSLRSEDASLEYSALSEREFYVFLELARGRSLSDIAEGLAVSVKTVSTYKMRIYQKLQLENNSELVRYALRHKLIDLQEGSP